jgi:hypothetical protein
MLNKLFQFYKNNDYYILIEILNINNHKPLWNENKYFENYTKINIKNMDKSIIFTLLKLKFLNIFRKKKIKIKFKQTIEPHFLLRTEYKKLYILIGINENFSSKKLYQILKLYYPMLEHISYKTIKNKIEGYDILNTEYLNLMAIDELI